jgi:hypothetical protein
VFRIFFLGTKNGYYWHIYCGFSFGFGDEEAAEGMTKIMDQTAKNMAEKEIKLS